jgi:hypothetical protein
VWFQHFHKAAGTSLVNLALANGEVPWPAHRNGNPLDVDGKELRLWEYSPSQLRDFVDECQRRGVTFVATEWGSPDTQALAIDSRVALMTCLRDPLDRFVSNYYFDLYAGYTRARDLRSFMDSRPRDFVMPDYYCRVLARCNMHPGPVDVDQEARARAALSRFDCVLLLGRGFDHLHDAFGWKNLSLHENRGGYTFREALGRIRRGKPGLVALRFLQPKRNADEDFVRWFAERNAADFRLFDAVSAQGGWASRPTLVGDDLESNTVSGAS